MRALIKKLFLVESITTSPHNTAQHLGKESHCSNSSLPLLDMLGRFWHVSTAAVIASHWDSLASFLPQQHKIHTEVPFWWLCLPPIQMTLMDEYVWIEFTHEMFPIVPTNWHFLECNIVSTHCDKSAQMICQTLVRHCGEHNTINREVPLR